MLNLKDLKILLIEDDELDVIGVTRALKKLKMTNPLVVASDGIEALDILRGRNGKEKLDEPFIILLDLSMPRMSGIEFLTELRGDAALKDAKVFILTISSQDDDIYRTYKQGVLGYIIKSDPAECLRNAFKSLGCD